MSEETVVVKDFFSDEKKIYDSVHGFIKLDQFEKELIDSVPFQRLHYIRQLGVAYFVYPGATHTRFEHSLGVMQLSTRIFHNVSKMIRPDVFHFVPRKGSPEYHYWRRVLRFASLCHDLGHLPFSHLAENEISDLDHLEWTLKIIESDHLLPLWEKVEKQTGIKEIFPERSLVEDIGKLTVGEKQWKKSKKGSFTTWEKVMSEIIVGDFFGSDRIDYLLRDSRSTGVAYGLFDYDQLIEMIRILPSPDNKECEFALGMNENGMEACEALLLARHFMYRRIYHYSTVKAYNFHFRRFMKSIFTADDFSDVDHFLRHNDTHVISELHKAAHEKNHIGHDDALRIINKKNRFKAIAVSFDISEKELFGIQNKENIPDDQMVWEMQLSNAYSDSLSFPVSRHHLMIENAKDCSDILNSLSQRMNNWIYVSPEYEILLTQALENWRLK